MGTDPLFVKIDGAYYWYENDHQGTPQKIIATSGSVVWAAVALDSFGNVQIQAANIVNNLRMPGQYYDEETGLHYNWHRYYDPAIGRYLQTDPIGDGLNLYAYCNNDPVNFMDPMGLCAAKAAWNRISWEASVAWGWFYENIYQYMVPGQIAWENAQAAYDRGDYGWAAFYAGETVVEDVIFWITFGYSQSALQSTRHVVQGVSQTSKSVITGMKIFRNSQGVLTNGTHFVDEVGMAKHVTGSLTRGKSQFLFRTDANRVVLEAAAKADKAGLWVNNQAKVFIENGPIGIVGKTGELTNWVNVTRTNTGWVHGWPAVAP
jgi:RHS repeat-associated protein